jgi:hypothetical protein
MYYLASCYFFEVCGYFSEMCVFFALALLCACCAGCAHVTQYCRGRITEDRDDRCQEYDLEGQQFRLISLSRNQDGMIVAKNKMSGDHLHCCAEAEAGACPP